MNGTLAREPVAVSVALGAVLATAVALVAILFPERLTPEATAAIIALGNAVIALGVALFARARVSPI